MLLNYPTYTLIHPVVSPRLVQNVQIYANENKLLLLLLCFVIQSIFFFHEIHEGIFYFLLFLAAI